MGPDKSLQCRAQTKRTLCSVLHVFFVENELGVFSISNEQVSVFVACDLDLKLFLVQLVPCWLGVCDGEFSFFFSFMLLEISRRHRLHVQ